MYGFLRLQNVSGKSWRRLFTYFLPVVLMLRYLLQTPAGTLLTLAGVYGYLHYFGEVKPWTPFQLLLWVDELDGGVKASVVSSVLTILGFIVAFEVAGKSWKIQALGQLKFKLVDEIQLAFSEVEDLVISFELFAGEFAKTAEKARIGGINTDAMPDIQRLLEKTPKFIEDRARFSEIAVSIHGILGRNFSLLTISFNAVQDIEDAIDAITQIAGANAMWSVIPLSDGPHALTQAAKYTDVAKLHSFTELCDAQGGRLTRSIGVVRGILLGNYVEPNIHTFLTMWRKGEAMEKALPKSKR